MFVFAVKVKGELPIAPLPVPNFPMTQLERALCVYVCVLYAGVCMSDPYSHTEFKNKGLMWCVIQQSSGHMTS